ncbi:MAG: hypothetical protein HY072_01280 [Deltaproteobacteria bacterium]|nr:hypothetical protein [Deltaproteobacteria bacterium]
MKLRLENKEKYITLCVSEDVLPEHVMILQAGIKKLIASGKKNILLDLIGVTTANLNAIKLLQGLEKFTESIKGKLSILAQIPGVANTKKREDVDKYFLKEMNTLLAVEAALHVKFEKLAKQKSELEKKIISHKTNQLDPKNLRKENSGLKQMVEELESYIQKLLKQRIEQRAPITITLRNETITKTVVAVLEQEGILPVK